MPIDEPHRSSTLHSMTIPSVPTDNLFKFQSIAGIVIVIVTVYWFGAVFLRFYDKKTELQRRVTETELDLKFLREDSHKTERELDRIVEEAETLAFGWTEKHTRPIDLDEYDKRVEALKASEHEPSKKQIDETFAIVMKCISQGQEQRERLRRLTKLTEQNRLAEEESDNLRRMMFGASAFAGVATLFGIGLSLRGFKKWAIHQSHHETEIALQSEELEKLRWERKQRENGRGDV